MTETDPNHSAEALLMLLRQLVLPAAMIERTMVHPADHQRHENVAEHSFTLGTVACALAATLDSKLNLGQIAQYALVHDLVEVYAGDTTVWASDVELAAKPRREAAALQQIGAEFDATFPWIRQTIVEYERLATVESRFVYALDKILPHAMVVIADHHPVRPSREAYIRSERIARQKISQYPDLLPLFEHLCHVFARNPHYFKD